MAESLPVGLRFSLLARAIKKQIDEAVCQEDLTGAQLFVLRELRRLEQTGTAEINQKDLEAVSHVTHPTMTDMLQRLEKKGYVVCTRSELDRRHKCVASTEKARSLRQRLDEADKQAFQTLCEGLSQEEIEALFSSTDRMLQNAGKILGKGCERGCDQNPCRESARV